MICFRWKKQKGNVNNIYQYECSQNCCTFNYSFGFKSLFSLSLSKQTQFIQLGTEFLSRQKTTQDISYLPSWEAISNICEVRNHSRLMF